MKRKDLMKVALATIVCVMAGHLYFADTRNDELKKLALDNVEALATSEGDVSYDCLGSGSVSCHGDYVEYMIEGYSLGLE